MSRRTILILTAVILIALGAWVYVAYKKSSTPGENGAAPQSFLNSLFPFGASGTSSGTVPSGDTGGDDTTGTGTATPAVKALVQISDKLTAGFTVLPPPATTPIPVIDITAATLTPQAPAPVIPVVRFVEKGTGYVYDADALGNNQKKTSGTVIARAAEALFGDSGNTVIVRYAKSDNRTAATFLGHINKPLDGTSDGTLTGNFLADGISDIAISNDGKNLLYLLPTADGTTGLSMGTNGGNKRQRFTSSFSEWLLTWSDSGPILTTKASALVPGYAYLVTSAGIFQKIAGDINGLTTKMSPDGKVLLYSVSDGESLDLHMLRLSGNTDTDTGLQTLPEKCAWNTASTEAYCGAAASIAQAPYPDAWYQGLVHFNDAFWKIDAKTGITTQVDTGEGNYIDATNLAVDQKEQYLFFINKIDESLWSLSLAPAVH